MINTSIGYSFAKYSILFTANQEYGFVRKIQGTGKIILQILQILAIIKMRSFYLFIFIMILENLYSYYFYRKHYKKKYNYIVKVIDRDKNIVKDMKNLFWHKIGTVVVHNTDFILLSKFVSLSIVGVYSSYLIVYQTLITLIGILTSVLTPKIGIFVVNHNKEEIYEYWNKLYSIYIFIATIFIICTDILIEPFMNLWLGKDFFLSKLSIMFILVNLFIHLTRGVTDCFKTSCGFFDDTYTPGLESLLNFIFSFILVQKIGLNGVILGTVISNIIIILLLKPILVFKRCFNKSGLIYIKDTLKLFTQSLISMVIVKILSSKLSFMTQNIISWKQFIIKTIIIGAISLSVTCIIFILNKKELTK
ncbi:polysaccharide biosynthesis protein [Cetobacterium somerae]|uniref:polysaccharide biosynthesis protein n=1 Tax=Cetobacterium somerae TaxID=188913 RepID=UPI00211E49CF|nr:polysaccharide biosynthesis protein [Cetobacterium somerae]MCQ9628125.1 polysaccharide biosynthesis protein [Cetobacterium somerae]